MTISNLDLPVQTLLSVRQRRPAGRRTGADGEQRPAQCDRRARCGDPGGVRRPQPDRVLRAPGAAGIDWSKVTISLADERWVPVSHPDSNEGLLRRHLLQGPAAAARLVGLYQSAASLEEAAERATPNWPNCRRSTCWCWAWARTATPPRCSRQPEPGSGARPAWCAALPADAGAERTAPAPEHVPGAAGQRAADLLALHGPGKLATLNQALAGESYEAMPIRAFSPALEIYWCP